MGLFHFYKQLYISHKLHEAKKPRNSFLGSLGFPMYSFLESTRDSVVCLHNSFVGLVLLSNYV
jgi:hypothetical protein